MRLLYRWFCRVIGVGSALDMVNLYVVMLIGILGVFIIFLPEDVESRKPRSPHRHGHNRHHHHRKHPKLRQQLPLDGNFSVQMTKRSDFSPKNLNVTNIVSTTPWVLNQTSTSLFLNSSFADNEGIVTLYRNINLENSTSVPNSGQTLNDLNNSSNFENYTQRAIDFRRSTLIPNSSHTPVDLNDLLNPGNYKNSSNTDSRKILIGSQETIRVIEESTTQIFVQSFANSLRVQKNEKIKADGIGSLPSNTSFNITEVEPDQVVEDLEELFGSAEDRKHLTNAAIETPVVELIRKKRSAVTEEQKNDAMDEKTRKATLLDFNGPSISNDPQETHIRVKRDGSELNDDRSALSSFDSTYLRNLEDSFALSALEVQAKRLKEPGMVRRETGRSQNNLDSVVNIARSKRDTQLNGQRNKTNNGLVDQLKFSPAHLNYEANNYTSNNRVNELEHLANNQSSPDSGQEDNSDELAASSRSTTLADSTAKSINSILDNRVNDVENLRDSSSTVDADHGDNTKFIAVGSRTSTPANGLAMNINSISHDRVNVEDPADRSSTVDLDQGKKTNYFQAGSQTSTPANLSANKDNSVSRNRVNVKGLVDNSCTLDSESTNDFAAESPASTPANSFANNVNSSSENRVNAVEHSVISSSTLVRNEEVCANDSALGSRTSTPGESLLKDFDSILENRVNDVEPHARTSFPDKNETETNRDYDVNKDQSSIRDEAVRPQRSPSGNSILMDDNSITRYGLDDVYPEIIQDPENPSPMVQLVRTKRFGDGIVYPEAPDASYANEMDNSRTVDEPYAEDNRIIDSMLSKVDYRSIDEQDRSARSERLFNEAEIDADKTREEAEIRGKRGTFPKRTRKKAVGGHRGHGKHKKKKKRKHHKGRAKNHHPKHFYKRDLTKREFNVEYPQSDIERDDIGGQFVRNREEAISPHDGRRRREFEDQDDENFHSDTNENAGRVRRDIQRIPEADFNRESISSNAAGLGAVKMEGKSRDKRNSAHQELKYIKNAREADAGQNQSKEITDKQPLKAKAAGPIRDMKQLVTELLTKVDELQGYIAEGSEDEERNKNPPVSRTLSNTSKVDGAMEGPLKLLQQTTNSRTAKNVAPSPANNMRQPKACCKDSTSWNRESQPSKNNRPTRNLRGQHCGKNLRQKRKSHHKWGQWTDWSSCSVTCGRGRQIRWRHCVAECVSAETEMEEKACQLPACAPGKFLGIFG